MAIFSNPTKNIPTFANISKTGIDQTWDEATYTWNDANGTWDVQYASYTNQTKNIPTFANKTKN